MEHKHSTTGLEAFQEMGNHPGGRTTDARISCMGWQSGETALHKKERNQAGQAEVTDRQTDRLPLTLNPNSRGWDLDS